MALVVGLILLVLMTVLAISAFNVGNTSTEVVGNMQHRNEVTAAANSAIEEAISTTRLFQSPSTIFLDPCTDQNTRCVDVDGDGTTDVNVSLTPVPACIQSQIILSAALNFEDPEDFGCTVGSGQSFGIEGTSSGNSLCANSLWEITAVAQDAVTETQITIREGAAIRVGIDDIGLTC